MLITAKFCSKLASVNTKIKYKSKLFYDFLKWQPCHSSVMVFCSCRAIHLRFCQWQYTNMLVVLSKVRPNYRSRMTISKINRNFEVKTLIKTSWNCHFRGHSIITPYLGHIPYIDLSFINVKMQCDFHQ